MDLSTLPLMPSMDLPPPVEVPVPTAQRPTGFDTAPNWQPAEQAADGCFCPSCQELRERDRTASSMRQQYGASAQPAPMIWLDELPAGTPLYDNGAAAFSGAVTGRISASQPAMASIPRAAPPVQSSRRIRGRYDFDVMDTVAFGLQGTIRWREPGTMQVYDDPVNGDRQWTYSEELPDGSLADRSGRRWRPTEV